VMISTRAGVNNARTGRLGIRLPTDRLPASAHQQTPFIDFCIPPFDHKASICRVQISGRRALHPAGRYETRHVNFRNLESSLDTSAGHRSAFLISFAIPDSARSLLRAKTISTSG
jgi:hypothetical protein